METINDSLSSILEKAPRIREAISGFREVLLSNLVMIGEIPAPTFSEETRVRFLLDRFRECGLDNISSDEADNALGILAGTEGEKNILTVAHLDTHFATGIDHTVRVLSESVQGCGVADNSLGLAVIASLPTLLDKLGIRLKSNLILMGSSRSLGRGNLEGLRFFLQNQKLPIQAGVCVEGVQLGRLSYSSLSMLRGEIGVTIPEDNDPTVLCDDSAVSIVGEIIRDFEKIPIPQKPRTRIILGSCHAGKSFNSPARTAVLRFEVRSEQPGIVSPIQDQISDLLKEIESRTGAHISLEVLARITPGGIGWTHPLTAASRQIMETLDIQPVIAPSVGELSALIAAEIPAVTLGITRSHEPGDDLTESIAIDPMSTGLAQIITLLLAIDEGILDGQEN